MRKEVMKGEILKKKRSKAITFADYFEKDESKLKELGCFNPILNFDTKLFVEPLLLKTSSSEIIKNSYNNYHAFFFNVLMLLMDSVDEKDKCFKAARKLLCFPEYKQTCIGYGGNSINGNGSGAELNEKILQSAKEIAEKANKNPAVLPFLALLEDGIGADRISDMVQNIIDEDICKYTIDIMQKIGLKGSLKYETKNGATYLLPENVFSHCPVKLLPKDILSNLPLADTFDEWILTNVDSNDILREKVNRDFGEKWHEATKKRKKEDLREKLKTDKEFFIFVLETLSESEFEHYDLEKDYEGLYRWLKDSERFAKLNTFNAPKVVDDKGELIFFEVEKIILYFMKSIKENELWRLFWTESGGATRHVKEFYSQMMFFSICETWLTAQESNLKITREFDKTTKQIEIAFHVSEKNKVFVKVKHDDNKELENGYTKHINYLKLNPPHQSFFLVMNFGDEESNQLKAVKKNIHDVCKVIPIDVALQHNFSSLQFEKNLIEFMGEGGIDKYQSEKSKGGLERHKETNIIKENIIKPVFLIQKKESKIKTITVISSKIIGELHALKTEKACQDFANKYSISNLADINLAFQYIVNHRDGGQISEWCYQFNKIPSAS